MLWHVIKHSKDIIGMSLSEPNTNVSILYMSFSQTITREHKWLPYKGSMHENFFYESCMVHTSCSGKFSDIYLELLLTVSLLDSKYLLDRQQIADTMAPCTVL